MSQHAACYAQVLLELNCTKQDVQQAQEIWDSCPLLEQMLSDPTVSFSEKEAVIRKIFPKSLQSFFCVLCKNAEIADTTAVFQIFYEKERQKTDCVLAEVEYVTPLTEEQQEGLCQFARKITGRQQVALSLRYCPELIGGFILRIDDFVYDRSVRYTMKNLRKKLAGQ